MSSDDNPKLPHDVVVDILKRLPVKSLLRFRCVCRSWRATIDDPCFVALHLNTSALGASNWHTVCLDRSDPVQNLCSVFSDESLTLPPQSQIEIPFGAPGSPYVGVGSCNGLICVIEFHEIPYGYTIHLWNLFTRKHKVVPPPGLEYPTVCVGFGFDARSNDYKIVRLRDDPGQPGQPQVHIYSLRSDSWRSLECEVPDALCIRRPTFFNGSLHWFVLNVIDPRFAYRSILSFDVAGEVFNEMAIPEEFCGANFELSMAVLNGLLAMFDNCVEEHVDLGLHSICSVWVMREYGVLESWTKVYTFEACAVVKKFHGFTSNGEVLVSMDGGGGVSWNPITRQFENVPLPRKCDVYTVVESFVSL